MERLKNLFNNSFLNYLVLFIALLYSFVLIFFGIDFADTFFYINMCQDYTSFPIMTLTLLIGHGWMSLFGDSLISFRVLNWTMWILSILLPYYILIPDISNKNNLKYVAISIILSTILNFNIFGGDVCTLFFLAISTTLIIKYYQTERRIYLFLFSLSSSLLILSRFSNIFILPATIVVFIIIEYIKKYKKLEKNKWAISSLKKVCIFCALSISFYMVIMIMVYGNLTEFMSKLTLSILNIDESHSLISMVKGYIKDFVKLFQYVGVCFLIYIVVNNRLKFNLLIQRILRITSIILLILFLRYEVGVAMYNWNLSLFYSAIVYSILIFCYISYIKKNEYSGLIPLSIIFVFSIIPVIGSNTGLLKLSPFLIAFLPTMIISNKSVSIKNSHLNYLFLIFLLFVFYTRTMIVYEDSKIANLNCALKAEKINHIKTTKENAEFIEDVLKEFKEFEKVKKSVLFYGRASYIFYYITNTKSLYQFSFWMLPESTKETKKAEPIIVNNRPVIFFIPEYPYYAAQYFTNRKTITIFEAMLIKNGYSASIKNSFIIYNP